MSVNLNLEKARDAIGFAFLKIGSVFPTAENRAEDKKPA